MTSLFHFIVRPLRSVVVRRRPPVVKLWVPGQHQDGALRPCSLTIDGRDTGITVAETATLGGRPSGSFRVDARGRDNNDATLGRFASFAAACRHGERLVDGVQG